MITQKQLADQNFTVDVDPYGDSVIINCETDDYVFGYLEGESVTLIMLNRMFKYSDIEEFKNDFQDIVVELDESGVGTKFSKI